MGKASRETEQSVVFRYVIYGDPASKKNSKRIIVNKRTGKPMIISSKKYNKWHKGAEAQFKKDGVKKWNFDTPLNAKMIIYRANKRGGVGDLNNFTQGPLDVLTERGIIKDDNRNIVYSTDGSRLFFDKENPRVEIELSLTSEGA